MRAGGTIKLEYSFDPLGPWLLLDETTIPYDNVYHEVTVDPMWGVAGQNPPVVTLRFRVEVSLFGGVFIDDVTVATEE
jgi:hypothetical protein